MQKAQFRILALTLVCGALLLANSRVAHAAVNLVADYRFNGTNASSVGSAPALVDIGTNSYASETVDATTCNVLVFPSGNGLSLATNGVIASDTYSIVMLFRISETGGYRKLVDFKNGTQDYGLYNLSNRLRFYTDASGANDVFSNDVYAQVVLTRDGVTDQVTGYVNGTQEIQFTDTGDRGVIDASNTLRFLIDDESTQSEESGGAVARIRLYDGLLSSGDVAALDTTHPDCGGAGIVSFDDVSAPITYNGWQGVTDAVASEGTYRQSNTTGAKATIAFQGTKIKYFFIAGPTMGKVDVYIDKVKVKSVCLYAPAPVAKSKTVKNLANSKHKLVLRVTGQTCNGGSNSYVSLDRVLAGTTAQDTSLKWNWNGWSGKGSSIAFGNTFHMTKSGSAAASFSFHGTSVQFLTLKGPTYGQVDVKIDGSFVETLDLSNASNITFTASYNSLADADHTIELVRNQSSGNKAVVVDGFRGPITLP